MNDPQTICMLCTFHFEQKPPSSSSGLCQSVSSCSRSIVSLILWSLWQGVGSSQNEALDLLWLGCVCQVTSVMSNSLRPHGLQPARFLCPWILQARILGWVAISFFPQDLPSAGIEPVSLVSPALAGGFSTWVPPGKPRLGWNRPKVGTTEICYNDKASRRLVSPNESITHPGKSICLQTHLPQHCSSSGTHTHSHRSVFKHSQPMWDLNPKVSP